MTYPDGTTPHTWDTNLYFKYLIQLAISMLCTLVCEGRYKICNESSKDTYDNERECICNQLSTKGMYVQSVEYQGNVYAIS